MEVSPIKSCAKGQDNGCFLGKERPHWADATCLLFFPTLLIKPVCLSECLYLFLLSGNGIRNCTKCVPPFVLFKHYCIRECPKHGWVLDKNNQKCIECHASCSRCIGPTENDCIACSRHDMSLVGFSCKKECPHGTFPNRVTGVCERCHPKCETCSRPGEMHCKTCAKDLFHNKRNGSCSSLCPPGQFSVEGKCSSCHATCRTCNGPGSSDCLDCPDGQLLQNFTCVNICPDSTYVTEKDGIHQCLQCHPVCDLCHGPTMNSCIKCKKPLYIEGRLCVTQCSRSHSLDEHTRTCLPCGSECKTKAGARNRSVHDQDNQVLQYVLDDSHKNSFSLVAVTVGSVSVVVFLLIFGILQFRTKTILRGRRGIKATITKSEDEEECRASLIEGEENRA